MDIIFTCDCSLSVQAKRVMICGPRISYGMHGWSWVSGTSEVNAGLVGRKRKTRCAQGLGGALLLVEVTICSTWSTVFSMCPAMRMRLDFWEFYNTSESMCFGSNVGGVTQNAVKSCEFAPRIRQQNERRWSIEVNGTCGCIARLFALRANSWDYISDLFLLLFLGLVGG